MTQILYFSKSKADNNGEVNSIESSLDYFSRKIKEMPKDARTKQVKKLGIANKILYFNEQNQKGQSLKIQTLNQMVGRLPISLAQLNAGNNSKELKNKIIQLLYCLYISKNSQKASIKVCLALFRYGNNFYDQ